MITLKEEYKNFLNDIEKNIKNKEDLLYIKTRFAKFLDVVMDQMEYIMDMKEDKIQEIEKMQSQLEQKLDKVQNVVDNIERDIYSEDGVDFEITCPYCEHEFIIDVDENKTEVECPNCENIIELDWSGDPDADEESQNCQGSCHGCHGCDDQSDEDDDM